MLDFLLNFIKQVGVYHPFVPGNIRVLFKVVNFSYFFIILMQNLLNIILHFLYLLLKSMALVFFLVSLQGLHLLHLSLQYSHNIRKCFLNQRRHTFLEVSWLMASMQWWSSLCNSYICLWRWASTALAWLIFSYDNKTCTMARRDLLT